MKLKRKLFKNVKFKKSDIQPNINSIIEKIVSQCYECKLHHYCMSIQFRNWYCLLSRKEKVK